MKLTDRRTIVHRDIKLVALCTACLFIGGISVRLGDHLEAKASEPKWVEQQLTIHLDPFVGSCQGEGCEVKQGDSGLEVSQEATKAPVKKEFQLSNKALSCVAKHYETAQKISSKFGEYRQYALELFSRESCLDSHAINPSSGACGIVQSYPCSKMGCTLDDVDCQVEWGFNYVQKRYVNAQKALEFHNEHNWY